MKQQVALVTGASRGIGRAIALALAQQQIFVVGTATTAGGAGKITSCFQSAGLSGTGMTLNVNDPTQIEAVIQNIAERFGEITILVNNAGITRDNLLMRMGDEEWDDVLSTNLKSVFRLSKAVLRPMMKARFGRIINISSVVGHMGNPGQVNYAAAKAGITGMTKSLAQEVGSRGITVNSVAPGFIDTDMTRDLPEKVREQLLQHIPLGKLGVADDIAAAVVFLVSSGAAYITGQTLHVNGGLYMA